MNFHYSTADAKGNLNPIFNLLTDLKFCSDLQWGTRIHAKTVESHNDTNMYALTALIKMYMKCGNILEARWVFESIEKPDVVSWTALILGCAENGEGLAALGLFSCMKACGCAPNSVTYVAALKACIAMAANGHEDCLEWGKTIHSEIGCYLVHYVKNTLIDMYAKCGSMVCARRVFESIKKPDVVSWTALLLGYAENGNGFVALDLFSRMKLLGCAPDSVLYVVVLKACTSLIANGDGNGCIEWGRRIHSEIGRHLNLHVQVTLIDMYAKCNSMIDARQVFDSIQKPNVMSWTALLSGYAENGEGLVALELFSRMKTSGCVPNSVTYVTVLKACTLVGALPLGRKFHSEINEFNIHVVTCLINFYAKCGSMVEACEVFNLHSTQRDIQTWTALLAGYGRFGNIDCVFNIFEAMQDDGLWPNAVTFLCILLCCSHAGLVEKAKEYFEAMTLQFSVTPTIMHYNCMVDVLGRSNRLNEAMGFIRRMPCSPDSISWKAILGACHKAKNVEIGKLAFESMDMNDSSAYVIMAHIYGTRGMWEDQEKVLETIITKVDNE